MRNGWLNRNPIFNPSSAPDNKMHTNGRGDFAPATRTSMRGSAMKHEAKTIPLRAIALALGLALASAAQADANAAQAALPQASADVQKVARWIADSRDNGAMPYLLVDKVNAQVYAFDRSGKLEGSAPALLGMAKGDRLLVSNSMAVDDIPPQSRITPAGRYVSRLALDEHGQELLVIDYAAAISLHPVVKGTPEERRAERLSSVTSKDNRVSHGCINVPKDFYANVVSPTFTRTPGVVYILPETNSPTELFGMRSPLDAVAGASGATAMNARESQSLQASAPN